MRTLPMLSASFSTVCATVATEVFVVISPSKLLTISDQSRSLLAAIFITLEDIAHVVREFQHGLLHVCHRSLRGHLTLKVADYLMGDRETLSISNQPRAGLDRQVQTIFAHQFTRI